MALIEFKNVNKYYGDYHALRDINLEIEKGQVVLTPKSQTNNLSKGFSSVLYRTESFSTICQVYQGI